MSSWDGAGLPWGQEQPLWCESKCELHLVLSVYKVQSLHFSEPQLLL